MSIEKNVQIVKNFLAALGRRDQQGLLALSAEDIEWIIPGVINHLKSSFFEL